MDSWKFYEAGYEGNGWPPIGETLEWKRYPDGDVFTARRDDFDPAFNVHNLMWRRLASQEAQPESPR